MNESQYDYDLFVIGAGSGGVRAARMSAQYGARVAIAEAYRVGGTCVIRGCVPKKLLVYASHFADNFELAEDFGWSVPPVDFNWQNLIANKDKEIDRLNAVYIRNLETSGVRIIDGHARFIDAHCVQIGDMVVSAQYILLAVGGRPFVPNFVGAEHVITSNEAFHLSALPDEIMVVGGGYIAVEFACIFHGLGVKTTLVYRGEKILKNFDADLSGHLSAAMRTRGIVIETNTQIRSVHPEGAGYRVGYNDGRNVSTGRVMYATGRVPCTDDLGLEAAGVVVGKQGEVCVDSYSCTNIDHIYAVGDVTDRAALTPIAIREGAAFATTVFDNTPIAVDHSLIPTAVFSTPELGTCGLSEVAARTVHGDAIDVYVAQFRPMLLSLGTHSEKMLMKMIVERKSERVLGLHIAGAGAGEMIQAFAVALTMGATKSQFDATIAVHPTATEEIVTFKMPKSSSLGC